MSVHGLDDPANRPGFPDRGGNVSKKTEFREVSLRGRGGMVSESVAGPDGDEDVQTGQTDSDGALRRTERLSNVSRPGSFTVNDRPTITRTVSNTNATGMISPASAKAQSDTRPAETRFSVDHRNRVDNVKNRAGACTGIRQRPMRQKCLAKIHTMSVRRVHRPSRKRSGRR